LKQAEADATEKATAAAAAAEAALRSVEEAAQKEAEEAAWREKELADQIPPLQLELKVETEARREAEHEVHDTKMRHQAAVQHTEALQQLAQAEHAEKASLQQGLENAHAAELERLGKEHKAEVRRSQDLEQQLAEERAQRAKLEADMREADRLVALKDAMETVGRGLTGSPLDRSSCQRCQHLEAELMKYRYRSLDHEIPEDTGVGEPPPQPPQATQPAPRPRRIRSRSPGPSRSPSRGHHRNHEDFEPTPLTPAEDAKAWSSTLRGSGKELVGRQPYVAPPRSVCTFCARAFAPSARAAHERVCPQRPNDRAEHKYR